MVAIRRRSRSALADNGKQRFRKMEEMTGVQIALIPGAIPDEVLDWHGRPIKPGEKERALPDDETDKAQVRNDVDNYLARNVNLGPRPDFIKGGSIWHQASQEVSDKDTLLGNRYLCRGGGMFIVAPSGQGKSSITFDLGANWALGRSAFDIQPNGKLRTLIIQAEDDQGDVTEMAQWILDEESGFTREDLVEIHNNTHVEAHNSTVGLKFLEWLEPVIQWFKPDIVVINPYTSYIGADQKNEEEAASFLGRLSQILDRNRCAAVIVHHTPKTNYASSKDYSLTDWMYRGSGCAKMTSWARAYIVFEPTEKDPELFMFVAAKRGKRIGWDSGYYRFFRHSKTGIKWEGVSAEDAAVALQDREGNGKRGGKAFTEEDAIAFFAREENRAGVSKENVRKYFESAAGRKNGRKMLDDFIQGRVEDCKLKEFTLKLNGRGAGTKMLVLDRQQQLEIKN
jgi:hypothetical protein